MFYEQVQIYICSLTTYHLRDACNKDICHMNKSIGIDISISIICHYHHPTVKIMCHRNKHNLTSIHGSLS